MVEAPAAAGSWTDDQRPAAGLALLVDQLWPGRSDGRVRLTLGRPPAGYRVVERYGVMPNVSAARMLIPLTRRATPGTLLAYRQLRAPRTRLLKQASAGLFALGLGPLLVRHRLSVCVPEQTPDAELEHLLLVSRLTAQLTDSSRLTGRGGPLVAAVGIAEPAPNRKPTVQLFDRAGHPVSYVKVGWNSYTRDLVRHEAEVLATLATVAGDQSPQRPAVLFAGPWNGLELLATAPLPAAITAQPADAWPDPKMTLRVSSWGAGSHASLRQSRYLAQLSAELRQAGDDGTLTPTETDDVIRHLTRLSSTHGETVLRFGAWHGDWSAWNLGTAGGQSWVWDWEHFETDAPLGFDLVHYAFQRNFVARQWPVPQALDGLAAELAERLRPLGVFPGHSALLVSLYLAEIARRAVRMARGGAGWNPRLRSGVFSAMRSRIRD
jgi:hypothetical protein